MSICRRTVTEPLSKDAKYKDDNEDKFFLVLFFPLGITLRSSEQEKPPVLENDYSFITFPIVLCPYTAYTQNQIFASIGVWLVFDNSKV